MGFMDLHTFNLAMLAKQAWHLIHNNGSLFYRLYKAWYFQIPTFWKLSWAVTPLLCGAPYWLLGISSMLGHVRQLGMVEVSPWHLALGCLTHLDFLLHPHKR